ncbi:hypothetical protein CROQUDRAFT_667910 [Cronartium quercuum f. sp. fusiforme G11]|uniref:Uncharacterized protein n=1 Tax=Cronartium quercuum f. sp. fusiforme G11 TaxID=708437 RepID=A0A9P6N816_9BASI|nr:hypothetical protein CROQUDRAFT_666864 [Cronartium quercuum f. sp. fusiforme G11]KAG0151317.1 hypothetical protein CROQUDRAFT_667910 [Cronartium quercuum f. sp. fusiforme G11]
MQSSSPNKLKKLKKTPRKRVSSRTAIHSNQTSIIQTRQPNNGHLAHILRKRTSNESFACAGASSPDLNLQQRFQTLHYDSLLKKAQTQKYHYLRHIDTLVHQTQPMAPRPRRCILRSELPVLKKSVRNKSMDEEVDMASNVRWLRLVSEVERAINTRPFKPIRPPLTPPAPAAEPAPALQQVDAVEDSYIPFPIPPVHPFSLVNKPPSKISKQPKTVQSSRPSEVAEQTSESVSDPARPEYHFDHPEASTRRSIPFQAGRNIRQSQELQVGRWSHLVQLERRAREASEEGMRKASLNSTISLATTSSLPQRKFSLLDRLRRSSTATKDSKSSLSISRPVPINSLFSTEFAFENPDPTRSQAVPLLTQEELSPRSSFVPPDVPPKILDESPRSAAFGASECPDTLVKAIPKTKEFSPSLQASSTEGGPSGAQPPTSPLHTSINDRLDNTFGFSPKALREETVSKDNNSKIILPEVFPLRVVKRSSSRHNFQMEEPNHLENKPQEVFDTESVSSIPERRLLESVPESRESFESRPEVMLAYSTGSLDASTSTHDGNQSFRKFSSKEEFESLAQAPSDPDNKSDTPDPISTEPKSLNSNPNSYFHVDLFDASKFEENSPTIMEMRTSSGPLLGVDVREEFGLHEDGEHRRSSGLKSHHVTSSLRNTSTGNHLNQLEEFKPVAEISIPNTVEHPTHHRHRNAVIGLRLTGRQADHHSHAEEPRPQSSSETGHSTKDCGHSSKQGVLQASSTESHTDYKKETPQNSVIKRGGVQQLSSPEQEFSLDLPPEVKLHVQDQEFESNLDQNHVKERFLVNKDPVRYLTFELPVKPEKIILEKGEKKNVEQAWASLSHYRRWKGCS